MLNQLFKDQLALGAAQAFITIILALVVMLIASHQQIHIEREVVVALIRGIVQVVAAGLILVVLFQGPQWTSVFVLILMIVAASSIAARRTRDIPGAFLVSLYGISFGAGLVILLMALAGVIEPSLTSLVPVGSMIISNAMNTNAQALERFRADVRNNVGQIETGLALGALPDTMVEPYVQTAVHSSLIPKIDSLSSLGIVWIPGLMSGMILAGTNPVYAAIYQFAVIAMIFASSGLTAVVTTLLVRSRVFSPAKQLTLRPGQEKQTSKKVNPAPVRKTL
ncbi:MAG TPA: ABC transporter permease [Chloroflexia bacterium]|nr:ABC transporter permease [Chloroflexia bacterium]